jgi:2-methylisocitrate lyase-like PEP mutase family enzyme
VDEPLLADLTGFGRGPLLDTGSQRRLGINVGVYPALLLQLAVAAVDDGLMQLAAEGTPERLLDWPPRYHGQADLLACLLQDTSDFCIHDLVG